MTSPLILPPRIPGKRGRRQVQHMSNLALDNFRTPRRKGQLAPSSGDVTSGIINWGMLGNDQYGDCGSAMVFHYLMAKAAQGPGLAGTGVFEPGFVVPTTQSTLSPYFAYGRAMGEGGSQPDQGVSNPTWFKFLKEMGVIELFAEINPTNVNQMHQDMLDFKGVCVGISLTDQAEQEFANHQPWNVTGSEQPDPQMGHDILLVKYDAQFDTFVTWGALQDATIAWEDAEATSYMDAWVAFSKEDGARAGVDVNALEAEINAMDSVSTQNDLWLSRWWQRVRRLIGEVS